MACVLKGSPDYSVENRLKVVKSGNRETFQEVIANIKVREDGDLDWESSYGIGKKQFYGII